jgi:hypothetical protein
MSLDVNMVKPALGASGMAGKADTKKIATKATQKVRVSHKVEALQKEKASQKVDAKDKTATAPNKLLSKPHRIPEHKTMQAQTPTIIIAETIEPTPEDGNSLHARVLNLPKPNKIHFTETTDPPLLLAYFISERRTYSQRVKQKIAETDSRDKICYSQKAGQSRSSDGCIKLLRGYWFSR